MIICVALNILNAIDVTFVKDKDKISNTMKIFNMIFSPIWPIYTLFLTSITTYKKKINLKDTKENTDELKRLLIVSNNAHLIEVITESSLQPLVQVFSIYLRLAYSDVAEANIELKDAFNALLAKDWSELGELLETSKTSLQFWSFLTSVASVAWSFQSNYARKKFGQMTILSRVIYFLYVLLAVNARITIIIGFILAINSDPHLKSPFTQIYVVIGGHMFICMFLDLWLNSDKYAVENRHCFWKIRDCLLRAFASIYIYHPTSNDETEDLRMHLAIDSLIFLEFVAFTSVIVSKTDKSGLLLGIVWAAYLIAIVLKVLFYGTQHPWSDILKDDAKSSLKWKSPMKEPTISHVKGPRKSKPLAILDRIREGMLCDGTICTGSDRKEKRGKRNKIKFIVNSYFLQPFRYCGS